MADFNPSPHDRVMIGGLSYTVMPHPAVPSFAFGQEGRKAFVYQVSGGPDGGLYALKQFKQAFRLEELVGICDELARFATWPGLEVCNRQCLHHPRHSDVLDQYDELEYAVLMPWIGGSTWYDMVIGMTPLTRLEAITYANAVAQVLAALEEAGLAHCDISAANVIINPNTSRAHLIDVEDLYAPGFSPPAALPAGTDGYAHTTAYKGQWEPHADRFAGAVIMAEMAAWHNKQIRKDAEDEHYFDTTEMQQDCDRYRLMQDVLGQIDARLVDLFEQAWFSDTLSACPPLRAWQEVFSEALHREQVAGVVSDWQPLTMPGGAQPADDTPEPAPQAAPSPPQPQPAPQPEPQTPAQAAPAPEPEPEPEPEPPSPATQMPAPGSTPAPQPQMAPPPTNPNILQPTTPPPGPPPSNQPISVQKGTGGPVIEWRTLDVQPQQPASAERRPIMPPQPEPEPEPAPEPDEPAPDMQTWDDSEAAAREDDGAFYQGDVQDDVQDADYDEDAAAGDEEPVAVVAAESAVDGGAVSAAPAEIAIPDGLLKPLLDLTHVDERSRPHLAWTESPDADYYLLQEDTDPDFTDPKEYKIKGSETRWSPGLFWRRSGRLYYRVQPVDGDGVAGPWSDTVRVRLGRD